jgi:adenylate kinase
MRIILLGAPGSGKGTQARRLVDTYKVPQISTGDILRSAISEGAEAGQRVEEIMKSGGLVPDDLVIELVSQRVLKSDSRRGFILDGFPRNIPQAQELDTRLGWVSRPIQIAINFEVDEESLTQRLTGRRTCENCGAIYNVFLNPPAEAGRCDACGSAALRQRPDDNEETVAARLKVYHQETELLVQYYRAQHKLRTLNANGDTDEIFARLCEMIDREIRPLENKVVSIHGTLEGSTTHTTIVGGKIVREVAGNDVRTTRVQPRLPTDNGEPAPAEKKSRASARQTQAASTGDVPSVTSDAKRKKGATGKAGSADRAKTAAGKTASTRGTTSGEPKGGAVAKKAASAGKSGGKQAAGKKTPSRKAASPGVAASKAATGKVAGSRSAAGKASAKASVRSGKVTKQSAADATPSAGRAAARKQAVKKAASKAAPARKASGKKATARKTATKKTATKKAATRRRRPKRPKPGRQRERRSQCERPQPGWR